MNAIPKDILESTIINAVLDFYGPYLQDGGRQKVAEAIKAQIGTEKQDIAGARQRAESELGRVSGIINNLLDNITEASRQYVDSRLNELTQQKQQLEARIEELDRLSLSQAEVETIIADAMQFLSGLECILRQGLPQEKLVALRQCIEKVSINKPSGTVRLTVRSVPVGNLEGTVEREVSYQRTKEVDAEAIEPEIIV
jgi:hypothetical protein